MVWNKETRIINQGLDLIPAIKVLRFLVNGIINNPAMKNLNPANCNGVVNSSPIFIPAKAVDQSKHAIIAKV